MQGSQFPVCMLHLRKSQNLEWWCEQQVKVTQTSPQQHILTWKKFVEFPVSNNKTDNAWMHPRYSIYNTDAYQRHGEKQVCASPVDKWERWRIQLDKSRHKISKAAMLAKLLMCLARVVLKRPNPVRILLWCSVIYVDLGSKSQNEHALHFSERGSWSVCSTAQTSYLN